jgi:hypothetical protein
MPIERRLMLKSIASAALFGFIAPLLRAHDIFLSTNMGELKNIILEGNVLGNASTPTKESDDGQKGSRR